MLSLLSSALSSSPIRGGRTVQGGGEARSARVAIGDCSITRDHVRCVQNGLGW